jgi:hypothetical protein
VTDEMMPDEKTQKLLETMVSAVPSSLAAFTPLRHFAFAGLRTLYISVHDDERPAEMFLSIEGAHERLLMEDPP